MNKSTLTDQQIAELRMAGFILISDLHTVRTETSEGYRIPSNRSLAGQFCQNNCMLVYFDQDGNCWLAGTMDDTDAAYQFVRKNATGKCGTSVPCSSEDNELSMRDLFKRIAQTEQLLKSTR